MLGKKWRIIFFVKQVRYKEQPRSSMIRYIRRTHKYYGIILRHLRSIFKMFTFIWLFEKLQPDNFREHLSEYRLVNFRYRVIRKCGQIVPSIFVFLQQKREKCTLVLKTKYQIRFWVGAQPVTLSIHAFYFNLFMYFCIAVR